MKNLRWVLAREMMLGVYGTRPKIGVREAAPSQKMCKSNDKCITACRFLLAIPTIESSSAMLKAMKHISKAAKELRSTHRLPSRKFKIWGLWKDSAMYLFFFGLAIPIGNISLHPGRPQAFRSSGPFVVAQGLVVVPARSRWTMLADRESNHCTVLSFPLSHAGKAIRPSTSCSFARTTCTHTPSI